MVRGNLRRRCVITPIYDQLAHFLTIQSGDVTSQNRLAAGVQTVVAGKTGNKVHRLFVATGHGQVLGLSCRRGRAERVAAVCRQLPHCARRRRPAALCLIELAGIDLKRFYKDVGGKHPRCRRRIVGSSMYKRSACYRQTDRLPSRSSIMASSELIGIPEAMVPFAGLSKGLITARHPFLSVNRMNSSNSESERMLRVS